MSCFTRNVTTAVCSAGGQTTTAATATVEPKGTTSTPPPFVLSYSTRVGVGLAVVFSMVVILMAVVTLGNKSTRVYGE
jgi:hypothetical protein